MTILGKDSVTPFFRVSRPSSAQRDGLRLNVNAGSTARSARLTQAWLPQDLTSPEGQNDPAFSLEGVELVRIARQGVGVGVVCEPVAVDRDSSVGADKIGNCQQIAGIPPAGSIPQYM
jgi:hypothetical protein